MGLLDSLAQGLRAAGGTLNPQVYEDNSRREAAAQQQQFQQQNAMLGHYIQAIQNGSMAAPEGSPFQASPAAQAQKLALENEAGYRKALSSLGPNASEDDIAKLSVKFGKPEVAAQYAKAKEDRAARLQTAADTLTLRQQQLEQQKELALQRMTDQRQIAETNAEFKRQSLALQGQQAAIGNQMRMLGLEIRQGQVNAQTQDKEDKQVESQVTKATTNLKDFGAAHAAAKDLNNILSTYTPETIPGSGYLKNTDIGKIFLSDSGKDVSSSVKQFGNTVLKAMSGSAVTAPEEIRQMAAQMADGRFSAHDFYIAWPKMIGWLNSNVGIASAGLSPRAKEVFQQRSGISLEPLKPRFEFDRAKGKLVDSKTDAVDSNNPLLK